jgi:hypothetical protein
VHLSCFAPSRSADILALLDFLMGFTMSDVQRRMRLASTLEAEALVRAALLRHGYAVKAGSR